MGSKFFSVRFVQKTNNAILNRLKELISDNGYVSVSVGVFDTSPKGEDGISPVIKARVNEFGGVFKGRIIPPRPFLRSTAAEKHNAWSKYLRRRLKGKILSDRAAVKEALEQLGEKAVYDVRRKILSSVSPANEPKYFLWKLEHMQGVNGYRGTLVKTGGLYRAVEYRLYRKREKRPK